MTITPTIREHLSAYAQKHGVRPMARACGVAPSTIYRHLDDAQMIRPAHWLPLARLVGLDPVTGVPRGELSARGAEIARRFNRLRPEAQVVLWECLARLESAQKTGIHPAHIEVPR